MGFTFVISALKSQKQHCVEVSLGHIASPGFFCFVLSFERGLTITKIIASQSRIVIGDCSHSNPNLSVKWSAEQSGQSAWPR